MRIRHGDHEHDVFLLDSGTMDTEIEVDGVSVTYTEADRTSDGLVRPCWLKESARQACDDGLLEDDDELVS